MSENLGKNLTERRLLIGCLAFVLLMDAFTTWYLLGAYPGGREANFLMAPVVEAGLPAMLLVKLVEWLLITWLSGQFKGIWVLWLGLIVAGLPVVNNLGWWVVLWLT